MARRETELREPGALERVRWGYEEIKEKRHGKIRTFKQLIDVLHGCTKFVAEQLKKDPNYRPPDNILKLMFRYKQFLDKVRPIMEKRLKEHGHNLAERERDSDFG